MFAARLGLLVAGAAGTFAAEPLREGGGVAECDGTALLQLQQGSLFRQPSAAAGLLQQNSWGIEGGGQGIFVAFLSAVGNTEKRRLLRERCTPALTAAGYEHKFFVGRPSYPDGKAHKGQGSNSTLKEIEVLRNILAEGKEHGDVVILHNIDRYKDLSDKTASLVEYSLNKHFDGVLKVDDDMCPNAAALRELKGKVKPGLALYTGNSYFTGTEYPSQTGADGQHRPYFSGTCYALSRTLASLIFEDDALMTAAFQMYGTDSEDIDVGRFYDRAKESHANRTDLTFLMEQTANLCTNAPQVLDASGKLAQTEENVERYKA